MGRVDSVPHCYLNLFITNRLELKMPPKKKHKPLEGQTWLRFANKRPRKRLKKTEMRTCRMSGKQSVGLSMHKQSRKDRKFWKPWLKSTPDCFMSKMEISCIVAFVHKLRSLTKWLRGSSAELLNIVRSFVIQLVFKNAKWHALKKAGVLKDL